MNKLRVWLSGLLGAQVVLVVAFFLITKSGENTLVDEYLLGINITSVNKMVVSSDEGEITIERADQGWRLPGENNLPADPFKVESAIKTLYDFKADWPVTTLENAHERFEVADDKFRRKVRIVQDNTKDQIVYLGTSPSFRKSHVRPEGDVNVYALEANTFDFSDEADGWLDKNLLRVSRVSKLTGSDFVLENTGSGWRATPLGGGAIVGEVNAGKVDELNAAFVNLTVHELGEDVPEFKGDDLSIMKVSDGTNEWTYQFFKEISRFFVKRNDIDGVFALTKSDYKDLTRYAYKDLIIEDKASVGNSIDR